MSEISLEFDLTTREIPVNLKDKDGNVREYVLREATGDASAKFHSARAYCADLKDGKPVKIHDVGKLEPLLVSLCLFAVNRTADGVLTGYKPVTEAFVRSLPQRVQSALYAKAVEISELGDKDDDATKLLPLLRRWLDDHKDRTDDAVPTLEQLTSWLEALDREQLGNVRSSSTGGSG